MKFEDRDTVCFMNWVVVAHITEIFLSHYPPLLKQVFFCRNSRTKHQHFLATLGAKIVTQEPKKLDNQNGRIKT